LLAGVSRSGKFIRGLSAGYFNQALLMLVGLWSTPFLLRELGQKEYGLWLILLQTITYTALLDFGVIALLPRDVAYVTGQYLGHQLTTELQGHFTESLSLLLIQTLPTCAAGALVWFLLSKNAPDLQVPLGIVLCSFVLLLPTRIFQAGLLGLQDLSFVALAQTVTSLVMVGLFLFFVKAGFHLYSLPLAWATTQACQAIVCCLRLRHKFGPVLPRVTLRISATHMRSRLLKGGWVTVSQLAQVLLNGADLFVVGTLLGTTAVVTYSLTGKLVTVLSGQPAALLQSAGPAISELRASATVERQLQACGALSQALLILSGLVACVILATNQGFVSWWVGAGHYGGAVLTGLLIVVMLLRQWNGSLVYSLFCFGSERRIAITTFVDGVVTVSVGVLLLRKAGLQGVPIGSIIGACLISLPWNLAGLVNATGSSVKPLVSPFKRWIGRFVALAGLSLVITSHSFLAKPQLLMLVTIAVTAVYSAVMVPAALQDPLGGYLRNYLTGVRRRFDGATTLSRSNI
jgi:O-antigen/teichoic acid export membrane protein